MPRTWLRGTIVFVLAFTLSLPYSVAQNAPAKEYQLKAAFIYNFTRFVEWPSDSFGSENSPLIIGVLGEDPFGTYIDELVKGEKIEGHPIIVHRFRNIKDLKNCHILFIHSDQAARIKESIAALSSRGILTVSDAGNFMKWGGVVQFFIEHNKLRLQINAASAKNTRLIISSKLLSLAKIYGGQ